ncbi:MAG: hypothetical protein H0V53_05725 [Rubrobacter sp.]|nr:hypothetical protein [Rubrobacter sp.]
MQGPQGQKPGTPQRFGTHRRAVLWSAGLAAKVLAGLPLLLLAVVYLADFDWVPAVAAVVALPLALWLLCSALLYLYVALSGGVVGRRTGPPE